MLLSVSIVVNWSVVLTWEDELYVSIVVNWSVVLTWEDVAFCVHSGELECCADLGGCCFLCP